MRELIADYRTMIPHGPVGRAVVTEVWGSAPRRPGSSMLVDSGGGMAGSVSGGCVEAAVSREIVEALEDGSTRWLGFSVSDQQAWGVGLACGGSIRILVEPAVRPEIIAAAENQAGSALFTVLEGLPEIGGSIAVAEDGTVGTPLAAAGQLEPDGDTISFFENRRDLLREAALEAIVQDSSGQVTLAGSEKVTLFREIFARRPRLVIFGGVHIAANLVPLAKSLGFRTIVADGRSAFLNRERFPAADELLLGWPEEVFETIGLDRATYVVVLTHDPKFDDPATELALRSPAPYVGVIGSRRTQEARRQRLRERGITQEELDRIHGPVGMDIGGSDPGEVALSIMAEIVAVKHGKTSNRKR